MADELTAAYVRIAELEAHVAALAAIASRAVSTANGTVANYVEGIEYNQPFSVAHMQRWLPEHANLAKDGFSALVAAGYATR